MRSQLAVRLGSQVPVVSHLPPDVASLAAAEETIEHDRIDRSAPPLDKREVRR